MALGIRLDAGGGATPDLTDPSNLSNPLAGGGGGGGSGSGGGKPKQYVYLGTKPGKVYTGLNVTPGTPGLNAPIYKPTKVPNVVSIDDGRDEWVRMSDKERQQWRDYVVAIGLISSSDANDYTKVRKAWEDSVDEAAGWYTGAKKKVTPYEAATFLASHTLSVAQAKQVKAQGKALAAKQQAMQPQRSVTVNLTDPTTARAIVSSAMQQYLGQDPSSDQVNEFVNTLQKFEKDNPTVQNTTFTEDKNGNPVPHTTQSGGGDPNEFIKNQVMSLPGYGPYQATTSILSWLEQALGTPVGN